MSEQIIGEEIKIGISQDPQYPIGMVIGPLSIYLTFGQTEELVSALIQIAVKYQMMAKSKLN